MDIPCLVCQILKTICPSRFRGASPQLNLYAVHLAQHGPEPMEVGAESVDQLGWVQ